MGRTVKGRRRDLTLRVLGRQRTESRRRRDEAETYGSMDGLYIRMAKKWFPFGCVLPTNRDFLSIICAL